MKTITHFLQNHPPFYFLPKVDLEELAGKIASEEISAGTFIFEEDTAVQPFAYVLQEGHVEILKKYDGSTQVIDELKVGDAMGVRAILTGQPYLASARATRDSMLLKIPAAPFLGFMEQYPRIALFFARGFAAGDPIIHQDKSEESAAKEHFIKKNPSALMRPDDILIPNPIESLLKGPGTTSLREAALRMKERRFGSFLIVDEQDLPLGIVTETDFIRRGSEKHITWETPVSEIMSSPVITARYGASAAQLIVTMVRHNIDHLVVTEDGSGQSAVRGIISQRDVLLMHGNNPAVLVRGLREAKDVETLARLRNRADQLIYNYLRQEISIRFIVSITTEINDALLERAFEISLERLAEEGLEKPALSFTWLSLGSEGRREQLRRSDQDNALVYEDPVKGQEKEAASYFHRLGSEVVEILVACGFARCPGDIMASNPELVKPLSEWKKQFSDWISATDADGLTGTSIFFDIRAGYGDAQLAKALTDHVFETIKGHSRFFHSFAQSALQHPAPTSFFGRLVLENKNGKKDAFDLKARAMRPLTHAARVLALANDIRGVTNTMDRYTALAEVLPDKKLFHEASLAYEILMRYRAINGFHHKDSGRYIFPKKLTRIERKTLESCFATVERVQQYIKSVFRVG